jgi:hypothetical protein
MATLTPAEILEDYSKRIFSDHEVVSRFIVAAATIPPSELIPVFPPMLVDQLRQEVKTPPQSPDNIIIAHGHVPMRYESEAAAKAAADRLEANQRAFRKAYFDGALAWHKYFAPF